MIVEVSDAPVWMLRLDGLALRLKSGRDRVDTIRLLVAVVEFVWESLTVRVTVYPPAVV